MGGGAVYNLGNFTAINTNFESNEANNAGGAVFNRGHFTATLAYFEANKAGKDGGAINNVSDGVVVVNDSSFVGNSAQNSGGAIENNLSIDGEGSLTLRRTLFVDSTAANNGGAIDNVKGEAMLENCTFVRNTATKAVRSLVRAQRRPRFVSVPLTITVPTRAPASTGL